MSFPVRIFPRVGLSLFGPSCALRAVFREHGGGCLDASVDLPGWELVFCGWLIISKESCASSRSRE
jgi:hypothetical protein